MAPKAEVDDPPALITSVEVADRALALPDLGATEVDGPVVGARQNRLQISFGAVSFDNLLHYRHKLGGADGDWSKPERCRW